MTCISLVCTVHEEKGVANASELFAILEHLRPEVIFLEVPRAAFDDYIKASSGQSLESKAIGRYQKSFQAELVPADLPTPGEDFFKNNQYLFERIEAASYEYRRLIDLHSSQVRAHGFAYLNSEQCANLWTDVYTEILSAIGRIADQRLVELYKLWNETIDLRDQEMVKNIQKYCRDRTFDRGVFLVGASHRKSIMQRSKEPSTADVPRIRWDFDLCVSPTNRGHWA
jgi:hypothetical protein